MIRKDFRPFNNKTAVTETEERLEEEAPLRVGERPKSDNTAKAKVESEQRHIPIKDWGEDDRPREKMMKKGPAALTNAELLAILIGGGTTKKSAVELMQDVLESCGRTFRGLNHMTLQDLLRFNGIGEAKALTIIAAAEIGKRRLMEDSRDMESIRSGSDVQKYMRAHVQDLNHEESWAMLLNNNSRLIHLAHLSTGGLAETTVDVRMLLKEAFLHDATNFILIHNHPSGSLRPSRADEDLTARVKNAGQTVNIRMIDHVIVTEEDYYSFAENGRL